MAEHRVIALSKGIRWQENLWASAASAAGWDIDVVSSVDDIKDAIDAGGANAVITGLGFRRLGIFPNMVVVEKARNSGVPVGVFSGHPDAKDLYESGEQPNDELFEFGLLGNLPALEQQVGAWLTSLTVEAE
ncbi:MAG: hypothetical protein R3313_02535 [Candidatus Saccharimonadales bacterium]|nr:hypothetical protein [Candidatus Saccharimonadales bacterium]